MEQSKINDFVEEIISVYKKHGLAISHEDHHGAFIIEPVNQHLIDWIEWAFNGPKRIEFENQNVKSLKPDC